MNAFLRWLACAGAGLALVQGVASATEDKGEGRAEKMLKARGGAPTAAQIDANATLEAILDRSGADAWSHDKGARIQGTLVQVEDEADGDTHLAIAPTGGETNTARWMIVEVTKASRAHDPSLASAKLKELRGKHVAVTGWLYYEPDDASEDPRGTRWELHPATRIEAL